MEAWLANLGASGLKLSLMTIDRLTEAVEVMQAIDGERFAQDKKTAEICEAVSAECRTS